MMEQTVPVAPLSPEILQQAAQWLLLGLLFEPPQDDWRESLNVLAAEIHDQQLSAVARQAQQEGQIELYHSIFGPGGPACPREVSHHVTMSPGGLLAELQAWYDGFAYTPVCREAPDHVAVEAGFIAFLHFKQAYAAACGQAEQVSVLVDAVQRFLAEHLAPMAAPLARALQESGVNYLAAAAAALQDRAGPAAPRDPAGPPGRCEADDHVGELDEKCAGLAVQGAPCQLAVFNQDDD